MVYYVEVDWGSNFLSVRNVVVTKLCVPVPSVHRPGE